MRRRNEDYRKPQKDWSSTAAKREFVIFQEFAAKMKEVGSLNLPFDASPEPVPEGVKYYGISLHNFLRTFVNRKEKRVRYQTVDSASKVFKLRWSRWLHNRQKSLENRKPIDVPSLWEYAGQAYDLQAKSKGSVAYLYDFYSNELGHGMQQIATELKFQVMIRGFMPIQGRIDEVYLDKDGVVHIRDHKAYFEQTLSHQTAANPQFSIYPFGLLATTYQYADHADRFHIPRREKRDFEFYLDRHITSLVVEVHNFELENNSLRIVTMKRTIDDVWFWLMFKQVYREIESFVSYVDWYLNQSTLKRPNIDISTECQLALPMASPPPLEKIKPKQYRLKFEPSQVKVKMT